MGPALKLLSEPPPGDEESCYIETAVGVASVLRSIVNTASRAVAYLDHGETFIHTSLLAVERDPAAFVFEQGPDAELNKRILSTAQITLVTSDHGVPVQFTCQKPCLTEFEGAAAFSASLPGRVLRLQRRGFYRLQGHPMLPLLKCRILREDQAESKLLTPGVMDLSCGGISVAVPNTEAKLEPGSRHQCTLELSTLGKIDVAVVVHGSRGISLPDGVEAHRYGIEFVNLDAKSIALIQRYISDEERKAKQKAMR